MIKLKYQFEVRQVRQVRMFSLWDNCKFVYTPPSPNSLGKTHNYSIHTSHVYKDQYIVTAYQWEMGW